ncbi:MAG: outer membrane beta-barrel protein [Woeseiaceae bacterium]|nr:outer membrane beta-barrel protein [Woeseiaceae bacterium]
MYKTLRTATLATLLVGAPVLADPAGLTGWYASAGIGVGNLSNSSLTYSDGANTDTVATSFDTSFAGGGSVGYGFSNGFTLEGEIMYRRNEFGAVSIPSLGDFTEGDFASLGFGVNLLYRFPIGSSGKWSGYAGPGYVWLQEIDIDFDDAGQQEISFETDDSGLQFKFGGRYDFSDRWFAEAGATYFSVDGVRMELPTEPTQTLTSDYDHWTASIAVGLHF